MGKYTFLVFVAILLISLLKSMHGLEFNSYMENTMSCLNQLTNNDKEFLKRIQEFSNWTNEEVPCYGRCLVYGHGFFNIQTNKWNKQHIVDVLGADVYNYCRHELDRTYHNACEYAYKGLRCLQQAQMNINKTKSVLLQCASDLNADMDQLHQYIKFEKTEAIPCLFKCFADKMNLYSTTYQRNSNNWIRAFGPVRRIDVNFTACNINLQRVKPITNACDWMYEDYICLERFIYNTEGLYPVVTE